MPWSEPIQPPKGKKLVTLKDAAAYILALPKSKQQSPEWQAAGEAVIMAAEDRGPLMHSLQNNASGNAQRTPRAQPDCVRWSHASGVAALIGELLPVIDLTFWRGTFELVFVE